MSLIWWKTLSRRMERSTVTIFRSIRLCRSVNFSIKWPCQGSQQLLLTAASLITISYYHLCVRRSVLFFLVSHLNLIIEICFLESALYQEKGDSLVLDLPKRLQINQTREVIWPVVVSDLIGSSSTNLLTELLTFSDLLFLCFVLLNLVSLIFLISGFV